MSKMTNLTDSQATILARLKEASRTEPVTKKELMIITGLSERTVRRVLGELRDNGYRICENSGFKGYWLAKSEADYKVFRSDYVSRIRVQSNRVRAMDNMEPQQIEMVI